MANQSIPRVFIVSDGRGQTCTLVVKAAIVQFEGQRHKLVTQPNVRTPAAVREIVEKAAASRAIIFYTLVEEDTRKAMADAAAELLVPTVDVLGPAFTALNDMFKRKRQSTPGLLYASERQQFDRHDAIDYTLRHDDGQRPHELDQADIVLVGVSRSAKSSTCFYLAYEGIKAANVPLIPEIEPSEHLLNLDAGKVIGLRVNVMRLISIREARALSLHLGLSDRYVDKREVSREVLSANKLMEHNGWQSFDSSYMAVEEIAREVMRMRGLSGFGR